MIGPQAAAQLDAAWQLMTETRRQLENLDVIVQTIGSDAWLQRQVHGHKPLRDPYLSPDEMDELQSALQRAARQAERFGQGYARILDVYELSAAAYRREAGWQVPDPQAQALTSKLTEKMADRNLRARITFALERADLDRSVTSIRGALQNFHNELDPAQIAARSGLPDPGTMTRKPQRLIALLGSVEQVRDMFGTLSNPAEAAAITDPVSAFHRAADELSLAHKIATDNTPGGDFAAPLERQLKKLSGVPARLADTAWRLRTPASVSQIAEKNIAIKDTAEELEAKRSQYPGLDRAHDIALFERRRLGAYEEASAAVAKLHDALSSGERPPSLMALRDAVRTQLQTLDNLQREASNAEKWWSGLKPAERDAITVPVRAEMIAAGLRQHVSVVTEAAKYYAYAEANPHVQASVYKQFNLRLREIRTVLRKPRNAAGPDAQLGLLRLLPEQHGITARKGALEGQALVTALRLHRQGIQAHVNGMLAQLKGDLAAHARAVMGAEQDLSKAGIGTTAEEARLAGDVVAHLTDIGDVSQHLSDLAELALRPAGDGHVTDPALRFAEATIQELGKKASRLQRAAQQWQAARRAVLPSDMVARARRHLDRVLYQVDDHLDEILYQQWRRHEQLMSAPERRATETARAITRIAGQAGTWDPASERGLGAHLPQRWQQPFQRMLSQAHNAQQELGKLAQAVDALTATAAQGDHLAELRKLPAAAGAASRLNDEVDQVHELVGDLTQAVNSRNRAAVRRAGGVIRAVTGNVTRLTGSIEVLRKELEMRLDTGLPAQIKALRTTAAARQSDAQAVAAQLGLLRDALHAARATAPYLPTDSDLIRMTNLASQVTGMADLLGRAAEDFTLGGARRRQGLLGLDPGGIPAGTGEAVLSVSRAAVIVGEYTQSLEQISGSALRAAGHAAAGRIDEAVTQSRRLYRQLGKLQSQLARPQQARAFVKAMSASARLMLPAPRDLADLAAAASNGATAAAQLAPVVHDALDAVRATRYWTEVSELEMEISDAEKLRDLILRTDAASPFFSPLALAADKQATIEQLQYLPLWGLPGGKFERPALTPRTGEFGLPLLVRILRHPDDLLRALVSENRRSVKTFGAAEYMIRDAYGDIYTEAVTDQQIEMDRGSWPRDLNERAFAKTPGFSWEIGPLQIALTPIETRTTYTLPVGQMRSEQTRHTRNVAHDGTPLRWRSSVEGAPAIVVPESSVQAVHMARSKAELHWHWDLALPWLGHLLGLLPEQLRPEMYSNARIAVNKKLISTHDYEQLRQIRSLRDALIFLATGSAQQDSLQIEVSFCVLRVQLIPQKLLENVPFAGSKIFDLIYWRILEFKYSYDGAAAQDALIRVLERAHGGVLLGPKPLTHGKMTAPSWAAGVQRVFIDPLHVAEAISGRRGDHISITVPDRQLQLLRGNVSHALDLLTKGAGRVATESFRHTGGILRGADLLNGAVSEGKIDPARAQRIRNLATEADELARELAGPVKADPASKRDAPAVFSAKTAELRARLTEISNLLQDTSPNPPPGPSSGTSLGRSGRPSGSGGTSPPSSPPGSSPGSAPGQAPAAPSASPAQPNPGTSQPSTPPSTSQATPAAVSPPSSAKAAVQPAATLPAAGQSAATPENAAATAGIRLVPDLRQAELARIGSLVRRSRTGTVPGIRVIIADPGFVTFAATHPGTYRALRHPGENPDPEIGDLEIPRDEVATSLTEILGAFRAMAQPPAGPIVVSAAGEAETHRSAATIAARIQAEFPSVPVVVVTSGPAARPAAAAPQPEPAAG